ncbi:MAG: ABC transporter ATP-binding protein [Desulfobacterales bacterium]
MMSGIAIRAEKLSKQYRIGLKEESHDSLAVAFYSLLKKPWTNFQKYRSLYRFKNTTDRTDARDRTSHSDVIWALKDVSMTVKKGETVGIIGQNGAGKSTLLKVLSRITHPTSGYAEIMGRVSSLLEVGTGFHPELSGRDNVYLNGTILGMRKKEIDQKFDQIVDFSGVETFIDTPVKRYSSGMKVRLAFSVAAHLEPDILIVDEVLAVGDLAFQKKCIGKMESSVSEGRTILFVSHNMAAVSSLCERGILIEEGTVVFDGKAEDAIDRYVSNSSVDVSMPISERSDRRGSGDIRVTDFWIENEKGNRSSTLACNEKLVFNISYRGSMSHKKLQFVVSVYDEFEQRLLRFDSSLNYDHEEEWPSEGIVKCSLLDRINLKPGTYKTHFAVFIDKTLSDYISDAIRFDVIEADYFGTGKLHKAWPKFLLQNEWSIAN